MFFKHDDSALPKRPLLTLVSDVGCYNTLQATLRKFRSILKDKEVSVTVLNFALNVFCNFTCFEFNLLLHKNCLRVCSAHMLFETTHGQATFKKEISNPLIKLLLK